MGRGGRHEPSEPCFTPVTAKLRYWHSLITDEQIESVFANVPSIWIFWEIPSSRIYGYPSVRFVKIYGGGRHEGHHGTILATVRATGEPLRQIGIAYADDVAASSAATRQALRACADIRGPQ